MRSLRSDHALPFLSTLENPVTSVLLNLLPSAVNKQPAQIKLASAARLGVVTKPIQPAHGK